MYNSITYKKVINPYPEWSLALSEDNAPLFFSIVHNSRNVIRYANGKRVRDTCISPDCTIPWIFNTQ
jgi:hypothetical protein